jgi:hypothetical protein
LNVGDTLYAISEAGVGNAVKRIQGNDINGPTLACSAV